VNELLLLSALIGATLIVVRGTIMRRIRAVWPALLRCGQCTGFWVGAVAGGSGIVSVGQGRAIDAIVVGSATSFLAMVGDGILIKLLGDPGDETEKKT
jgi:hypothetical protein